MNTSVYPNNSGDDGFAQWNFVFAKATYETLQSGMSSAGSEKTD